VPNWDDLSPPGSGIGVYAEQLPDLENPALLGFVSWRQTLWNPNDETRQDELKDKDMHDSSFRDSAFRGGIAFYGVWQIPKELSEDYDIALPDP
jgi:hypothetical protein